MHISPSKAVNKKIHKYTYAKITTSIKSNKVQQKWAMTSNGSNGTKGGRAVGGAELAQHLKSLFYPENHTEKQRTPHIGNPRDLN